MPPSPVFRGDLWLYLMRCRHCDVLPLHGTALTLISAYYDLAQAVGWYPPINSGYRCVAHNLATVGADPTSWHQLPAAVDVAGTGQQMQQIVAAAQGVGFRSVRPNVTQGYVHLALFGERAGSS
jgi:Peptidase M15